MLPSAEIEALAATAAIANEMIVRPMWDISERHARASFVIPRPNQCRSDSKRDSWLTYIQDFSQLFVWIWQS